MRFCHRITYEIYKSNYLEHKLYINHVKSELFVSVLKLENKSYSVQRLWIDTLTTSTVLTDIFIQELTVCR